MDNPENGGWAFPSSKSEGWQEHSWGMSLRDYFAGQALTGMLSSGDYDPDGAAQDAYRFADAMLAERNKREGGSDGN